MEYTLTEPQRRLLKSLDKIYNTYSDGDLIRTSQDSIWILKLKSKSNTNLQSESVFCIRLIPPDDIYEWKRNLGLITLRNSHEYSLYQEIFAYHEIDKIIPISRQNEKKINSQNDVELSSELPGLFYRKYKGSITFAVNPLLNNKKIKRFSLFIENLNEFNEYKRIFGNEKLENLIKTIDIFNYLKINKRDLDFKMNSAIINQILSGNPDKIDE
jgi:hypothetical protein